MQNLPALGEFRFVLYPLQRFHYFCLPQFCSFYFGFFSPKTGGADPVARWTVPLGGLAGVDFLLSGKAKSLLFFWECHIHNRDQSLCSHQECERVLLLCFGTQAASQFYGKDSEAALGLLWMSCLPDSWEEVQGVQEGIPSTARWNTGSCKLCLVELAAHPDARWHFDVNEIPSCFFPPEKNEDLAVQSPLRMLEMEDVFQISRIWKSSVSFLFFTLFRGLCCFWQGVEPGFVLEDGSRCLLGLQHYFCWMLQGRCVNYFTCLCAACGAYKL